MNRFRYVGNRPTMATDPSGLVTLTLKPESPDSMEWYKWKAPPTGGQVGDTNVGVTFEYQVYQVKKNCKMVFKVKYTLGGQATIRLDVDKIKRLGRTNKRLTLETAYGHEQRHVQNFIEIMKGGAQSLEPAEEEEYDTQEAARKAAIANLEAVKKGVIEAVNKDKEHKTKNGPRSGELFPPIGTMPKEPAGAM